MSIQEQPVCYDIPEQTPSSSIVINRGNEEYDPFAADDEHENEQSTDTNHQKQESIRINNGDATPPVIDNTNASSSSDKSSSSHRNEQELRRKSRSPQEHHPKHSDRRSRSPYHQNHYSSDRKRLRPSSPDASIPTTTTVNNNESSNSEIISSSKQKQSYRNDNRKKSKHHSKHRSLSISSSSKSPSSPITSNNNNNKKSSDSKEEKSIRSSDNNSTRHSSKRDDYRSHRYNSSRNYYSHSSSSSKHSPRDYPSSTHQPNIDRRSSNPSRLPSVIVTSDGNTSLHSNESKVNETSTDDRSRIINRLKNVNDTNTPTNLPITNSNKTSSSGSTAFNNTNGGSQRSRNNLIQIVTTEATPVSTQVPPVRLSSPQVKPEPIKPPSVPSVLAKIESTTNPTDSSKTTASKTNGGTADDMLMEEMLLEEEQEQSPVKSIDLDSLTIPETSIKKTDTKEESIKIITTTTVSTPPTTTVTTTTTLITTSAASLTPSPTKKLYTLYKVPHTNHVTPPLSSRHKKQIKKEPSITQSDSTIPNKSATDDNAQRTSLDERISDLLGVPPTSSNKPTNSSTEQQLDTRPNPSTQIITTTSTPSDKSTESPQDITSLISTMIKKGHDHAPLTRKLSINDERRSTTSKHYTSEWLATQKPEEAPTGLLEELTALVSLPTLISSQVATNNTKPSISNSGEVTMLGKLSEAMSKLIHKQGDTNVPPVAEGEDAVPISAKHLERLERRKQREKRQSEIAAIAKEALKPAFRKHDITKDEYKEIMKKVVTKATQANEVDRIRIGKMIDAYVEKYRSIRQHYTSKTSTNSNGTKS